MHSNTLEYDVLIVGAGPAGCACALTLKDVGLSVALLDKATFPRDKVCGDAIPGRAVRTLHNIAPALADTLRNFPAKCLTKQTTVYYKQQAATFQWSLDAYTCTRMEFDNLLLDLVRKHTSSEILMPADVEKIQADAQSVSVILKNHQCIKAKIVIGADGAHSVVAKQLALSSVDRRHYIGSVRVYFSDVEGISSDNTEIYFDKRYLPGYLWVFPLPGNIANVGFGMLSSEIAKRRINIKDALYRLINETPALNEKFTTAKQIGPIEGFGLPLGSRVRSISGNRFMLIGDAASLIDPISGDGIGNAMLSGKLAAEQVIRCCHQKNFSAVFLKKYDESVYTAIGKELKNHYYLQRSLSAIPFSLDLLFTASKSPLLRKLISRSI